MPACDLDHRLDRKTPMQARDHSNPPNTRALRGNAVATWMVR